jgi:hypothetical protein
MKSEREKDSRRRGLIRNAEAKSGGSVVLYLGVRRQLA